MILKQNLFCFGNLTPFSHTKTSSIKIKVLLGLNWKKFAKKVPDTNRAKRNTHSGVDFVKTISINTLSLETCEQKCPHFRTTL